MDTVASRQFVLEGDGVVELYDGLYSEYLEDVRERQNSAKESTKEGSSSSTEEQGSGGSAGLGKAPPGASKGEGAGGRKGGSVRKLSYMEKKEYERLEGEIEKLSKERDVLEGKLEAASNGTDYDLVTKLSQQLADVMAKIDQKSDRWLVLAEIAEGS